MHNFNKPVDNIITKKIDVASKTSQVFKSEKQPAADFKSRKRIYEFLKQLIWL
jgi:hypothetical protein